MSEQNMWGKISMSFIKIKPYVAMISLQFGYAGMFIITLVSLKRGFSHWVLAVYRHVIATLVFAPFAYFLEKKTRPKMTRSTFLKIMVLAFLEPVLDQNLYYVGVQYTSATFAAAITNVLPAVTFIMAVIFRMEKVNLKKIHSLAKVIGTLITVSGAMLMTLYTGPVVDILWYSHSSSHHKSGEAASTNQHWVTGTIMLFSCIVGWSGFFILQNNTLKEYPAGLSLTALICLMGTLEGGVVAVIMEHRKRAWVVGFDSRLLAAAYSGIVCSGIAFYLQGVVNKVRGPVFVTAFSPLIMIITAVLGAIVLSRQSKSPGSHGIKHLSSMPYVPHLLHFIYTSQCFIKAANQNILMGLRMEICKRRHLWIFRGGFQVHSRKLSEFTAATSRIGRAMLQQGGRSRHLLEKREICLEYEAKALIFRA